MTLEEVYESAALVKEVVDPSCNIIFGSGIDENMDEEVEITVIATGFSGATLTDDMKEEVRRTVNTDAERASEFVRNDTNSRVFDSEDNEDEEVEEPKQQAMTSRVAIDDTKIPPFLRKIKNKRF